MPAPEVIIAYAGVGAFGLATGSFLTVVSSRLPVMLQRGIVRESRAALDLPAEPAERFDLALPPSRCPACGIRVRWWQNVPVVSWLVLRGRCAGCGTAISWRYPAIELATAAVWLTALAWYGVDWRMPAAALFGSVLVALAAIDLETMLLPDVLVLPLLWAGLVVNTFAGFVPPADAILGAAGGYAALWAVGHGYGLLRGVEAVGGGDIKLFAALGAWLGWQALPAVLALAAGCGVAVGLVLMLAGRARLLTALPFGPWLAAAGWLALLAGPGFTGWDAVSP